MTSILDSALRLAAESFYVFPLSPNSKVPPKGMHFKELATRDEAQIRKWFSITEFNVGIYTGHDLLVVDVDNKGDKHGDAELLRLELEGRELPDTRTHHTPSGGRHLVYRVGAPVRQGADVLGPGLDVRSAGGYIVGPGSRVEAGLYTVSLDLPIVVAPDWLVGACGAVRERKPRERGQSVTTPAATRRAVQYLKDAPPAVEGQGGDEATYKVAARLKDMGVAFADALDLMLDHWNERNSPPWSIDDLQVKIRNAYEYGQEPVGSKAPESDFEPVPQAAAEENLSPHARLNRSYAFVIAGGGAHILHETKDIDGRDVLEHLALSAFHAKHAAEKIVSGKKEISLTADWMEWKGRRSYDGLVFRPQQEVPSRFYNLWRGFAVEPLAKTDTPTPRMQHALDAFLEHARLNVCRGDEVLLRWLLGYFAHIIQRPAEKPLVALVFQGGKGTGKNALVERVGALLGGHFLVTADRRYLTGNFNGHLENCLLFTLDEAFWSGDKQAEGIIKSLITGKHHVIEHKGKEPYPVENRTRICILSNEDWAVPASHDERRFAVFAVGDGRKQDRAFFQQMREDMEAGGYRLLLRFLMDYDLAGIDLNAAPVTKALLEQKNESLDRVHQWILSCLTDGRIAGTDFGEGWPEEVDCGGLRQAFVAHTRPTNTRSQLPNDIQFGKKLKTALPHITRHQGGPKQGRRTMYRLGSLAECRTAWEAFIGQPVEWGRP